MRSYYRNLLLYMTIFYGGRHSVHVMCVREDLKYYLPSFQTRHTGRESIPLHYSKLVALDTVAVNYYTWQATLQAVRPLLLG